MHPILPHAVGEFVPFWDPSLWKDVGGLEIIGILLPWLPTQVVKRCTNVFLLQIFRMLQVSTVV
jgi:hypothetical protein